MKNVTSRGLMRFWLAALAVLAGCASREASAPEAPQSVSLAYGGADASAASPDKAAEAAPPAPEPEKEPKKEEPKAARATIDESDPTRALAEAEKQLDDALRPRKVTGVHNDGTAPPAKEEPTADSCSIACRALASMRRSADRLCELAPSASPDAPRCNDAKERVTKAERRVRERCPSCAAAP